MCLWGNEEKYYCGCRYATELNGPNGTCVCQGILTVMNENGHCECKFGGSHNEVECGLVYFGIMLGSLVGVIVVLIIIIILIKLFTVGVALLVALIVECKNCKSDANDARRSPVVTPEPEAETEQDTCHPQTVFGPPIPIVSFITQTSFNSACPDSAVCDLFHYVT